eukprot:548070-Amphidinium_carterae.1
MRECRFTAPRLHRNECLRRFSNGRFVRACCGICAGGRDQERFLAPRWPSRDDRGRLFLQCASFIMTVTKFEYQTESHLTSFSASHWSRAVCVCASASERSN